jgi:hypothetical protein
MGAVAKKKKTRPALRTEYLRGKAEDRIKNFYLAKIPEDALTQKDIKIKERWENIWRLYKTHMKTSVAVKYHVSWCAQNGQPITEMTAYTDFNKATKIWGKISRIDRQAKLLLLDEMATDTYIQARDKEELGEMNREVANLIKINEQVEDYLEDSREPHKYELHLHLNGQRRTLDLNKLPVQNKEYQEVLRDLEGREADDNTFAKLIDEAEESDET